MVLSRGLKDIIHTAQHVHGGLHWVAKIQLLLHYIIILCVYSVILIGILLYTHDTYYHWLIRLLKKKLYS